MWNFLLLVCTVAAFDMDRFLIPRGKSELFYSFKNDNSVWHSKPTCIVGAIHVLENCKSDNPSNFQLVSMADISPSPNFEYDDTFDVDVNRHLEAEIEEDCGFLCSTKPKYNATFRNTVKRNADDFDRPVYVPIKARCRPKLTPFCEELIPQVISNWVFILIFHFILTSFYLKKYIDPDRYFFGYLKKSFTMWKRIKWNTCTWAKVCRKLRIFL